MMDYFISDNYINNSLFVSGCLLLVVCIWRNLYVCNQAAYVHGHAGDAVCEEEVNRKIGSEVIDFIITNELFNAEGDNIVIWSDDSLEMVGWIARRAVEKRKL